MSSPPKTFTRHTETLVRLIERARNDHRLRFIDAVLLPNYEDFDQAARHLDAGVRRSAFYYCGTLIQLIENVYLDLDLELNYEELSNQGWMKLFAEWFKSGEMQRTWTATSDTYGERFRHFCEHKLFSGEQPRGTRVPE